LSVRVLRWPYPCKWAYGMTDDTNGSTLESVRTVYEYCIERGIWPTRTVWALRPSQLCGVRNQRKPKDGLTLEDLDYRRYCQELSQRGIEFALHDVSSGNNPRENVIRGLETFKETFGYYPSVYICHAHNAEHPYWGEQQYRTRIVRLLSRLLYLQTLSYNREEYFGNDPSSPYYWSDICRKTIRYVRLYRTRSLNVLRKNPRLPYHQYDKPDVLFWFSGNAEDYELFQRVSPRALDKIAREDGAILHYAHTSLFLDPERSTASGLRPEVERALATIGERSDCWRSTVSSILDRCLAIKNIIVKKQKHGLVICNPTAIGLDDFQIEASYKALYSPSGEVLYPDQESRIRIGRLEPGSCLALYFTKDGAEVRDPVGVSRFEEIRMMAEEAKRQIWKNKLYKRWRKLKRAWLQKRQQ